MTTDRIETCRNLASRNAPKDQLLSAARELGVEFDHNADKRYQYAGASDLNRWEGVYFILFGTPAPGKTGYSWV